MLAELPQHYCNLSMTMITNKSNPYPYDQRLFAIQKHCDEESSADEILMT